MREVTHCPNNWRASTRNARAGNPGGGKSPVVWRDVELCSWGNMRFAVPRNGGQS